MDKIITVLVAGATGKTGQQLVRQLISKGCLVRIIVRQSNNTLPEILRHSNVSVIESSILDIRNKHMTEIAKGCDAVISCLGHVVSFKGIFGEPKKLCAESTQRLYNAIEANNPTKTVKFILMNTVGVSNPDLNEKRTWIEKLVLNLLHHLLPPHSDNEAAFDCLYTKIGKDKHNYIEWCIVRPDSLIDANISQYETVKSPVTGLFTGRPTTRANVAHFIVELVMSSVTWNKWKFKTPVIMNKFK